MDGHDIWFLRNSAGHFTIRRSGNEFCLRLNDALLGRYRTPEEAHRDLLEFHDQLPGVASQGPKPRFPALLDGWLTLIDARRAA